VLSNMAKQLEEALKRPLSGGKAGPAPAPNGPVATADDRLSRPAPTRIAHAAPAAATVSQVGRPPESPEPAAQKPGPMPAPVTKMRPEPEPANARPGPAAEPAPSGAGEGGDPFSVEEIEAEFARLLGRPLDPRDRPH